MLHSYPTELLAERLVFCVIFAIISNRLTISCKIFFIHVKNIFYFCQMKNSFIKLGVFSLFVLNTLSAMGAPVPPPPENGAPPPPGAPLDERIYLLLGVGLLYAFYYYKNYHIKKASK